MKSASICEKGNIRKSNQDAVLCCSNDKSGLFIVADGVGSSENGALASNLIVSRYSEWWESWLPVKDVTSFSDSFRMIRDLAEEINSVAYSRYKDGISASTLSLLFIHDSTYGILSVGDSRIYKFDGDGLKQLTRDDIVENSQLDSAPSSKNQLMSAVGRSEYLEYSSLTDLTNHHDVFFLCSDGVYRFIDDKHLSKNLWMVRMPFFNLHKMINTISATVVSNDTDDNYSMISVIV